MRLMILAALAAVLGLMSETAVADSRRGREATMILFGRRDEDQSETEQRRLMVERQIAQRGVRDERVLEAMRRVPRHRFVPEEQRRRAYDDTPLSIGQGQTISQPYIVGLMTELLRPRPGDTVLEIGTGSGYQAAVLAELVAQVCTIEIVEPLADRARQVLEELGYGNIRLRVGDGFFGWPEAAPFDGIILTAAPEEVPRPLLLQLAEGGRLVVPEGEFNQDLVVYEKQGGKIERRRIIPVRFVPMTGEAEKE